MWNVVVDLHIPLGTNVNEFHVTAIHKLDQIFAKLVKETVEIPAKASKLVKKSLTLGAYFHRRLIQAKSLRIVFGAEAWKIAGLWLEIRT